MFKKFLGIVEMPDQAQKLILKIFPLFTVYQFFIGLGNSFFILAFIDSFGFATAGTLMAVLFASQFITDYPAGSLADYIGQKYVIALSLFFFGIGCFFLSFYAIYFFYFIAALCIGIGLGQLNGAFESFLDNNYKKVMKDLDQDRKMYGFMYQRLNIFGSIAMAISFVIGGLISTYISRSVLFQIQCFLLLLLIPFIILFLNDEPDSESLNKFTKKNSFFTNLKGGLVFLVTSKDIFFLIIGLSFLSAVTWIWAVLFLFPLYNGYTGADVGVGILRAIIFIVGSIVIIYIAKYQKKLKNEHLGKITSIYSISFFLGFIILTTLIPMKNEVNYLGMIMVLLLMTISNNMIGATSLILKQRVLSVKVPSDKRNSVYSLITSIGALIQIPLLPIIGQVIEFSGFGMGLWILLFMSIFGCVLIFIYDYYDNKQVNETKITELGIPIP